MKILVTGGSGFFGENLIMHLLREGHSCINFDINPPTNTDVIDNSHFIQGDIRDIESTSNQLNEIDVVCHNVAQVPLAKNAQLFHDVNYLGTESLINLVVKKNISKIIYTSSSAIYGIPIANPVSEATQPLPFEDYGRAKLAGENSVIEAASKYGFKYVIARPRTILGKGRLGIFQTLFDWTLKNYNLPVFDGGKNIYQFVHSDDLASAICLLAVSDIEGDFNIGAEKYGSMRELLTHLIEISESNSKIKSLNKSKIIKAMNIASFLRYSPLGPYHAQMYGSSMYFDISKIKKLGWSPNYSNNEAIQHSFNWYKNDYERFISSNHGNLSAHKKGIKSSLMNIVGKML